MKNIFYNRLLLFICMTALVSSCSEDYLDATQYGSFDEETYYGTKDAGFKVVAWCYKPMDEHWTYQTMRFDIGNQIFDDADKGGSDAGDRLDIALIGTGKPLPTNSTLNDLWVHRYNAIARCNIALDNLTKEGLQLIDASGNYVAEGTKSRFISEVKFLRAWYYFDLVSVFGGVPLLTTTPTADQKSSLVRASIEDVRTQLLKDIDDCIADANVPEASELPASDLGRVTNDAALAFKSRVCLFFAGLMESSKMTGEANAEYALARDAAKAVIQKNYFGLVDDFQTLFRGDYIEGINSKECIFTIVRNYDPTFALAGSVVPQMNSGRGAAGGWGGDVPTKNLVAEFEPGDPRLLFTVIQSGDIYPNKGGQDVVHNYTGYDNVHGYHSRKDFVPSIYRLNGEDLMSSRWTLYLIRYAEVLLNYAEALNKTNGSKQEVADVLNTIRRRAFLTTSRQDAAAKMRQLVVLPVTQAQFDLNYKIEQSDDLQQAVRHERRVELAMEGFRFNDLIRWNNYVTVMQAYSTRPYANGNKGKQVTDATWPYPIPQTEIDRTGGSITQNPGYN
ncbi:MAG: RagB/SusD family nutrient uptake outer membrane protein [Prolixibacteraceae bacterium]